MPLTEVQANAILEVIQANTAALNNLLTDLMQALPVDEHADLKHRVGYIWSEYGDQLGGLVSKDHPDLWRRYIDGAA
jgi:hypothetical protein